ncbi:AAA family ATPase [Microbispora sp. NEAU-D428]|uniref:BTAD domain-containing putative transcriptional regulator n=1 Tax=Microbispora sitophila TaxID=2771537 RepID=UPI0018679519|nr:BTAD domain-containing putative transcriptional regulator [Microbispora sitophila]MBE3012128.1 AAA family ATPase [Microbispora sitophila]
MEFRVLGSVEVRDAGGAPVDVGGPRQRTVLARLLVAHGAVVSIRTLIEDVYGDAPPVSAPATVQSYVSHLRRAIEPDRPARGRPRVLVGRPPGYALVAGNVDAARFTDLVERAEFLPPAEALAAVEEALGLWRGSPYEEFSDAPWALTEVSRLRELRLVAVERRAQALLDLGRPQAVIADLEAETAADPLRERLWYLLALALYRTGRQADALAVLRSARNTLTAHLGVEPGPTLRALEDDILRQVESLGPVPPHVVLEPVEASTPQRAMPEPAERAVLGRDGPLGELVALTGSAARRGVAIAAVSGEPGIGKTSLLEAASARCIEAGYLVVWGRCHDTQGTPALWPWVQVLGVLEQHCPPPDRSALAGLLDDEVPAGSEGAALLRRNQAIAQWLVTAARPRPLVIVLDDVQWADPASLELLRDVTVLVGGMTERVPLSVVTAFRDPVPTAEAGGVAVDELLGRLAGYDLLRIRLQGLGAEAVGQIAQEMGVQVDDQAVVRLTSRTGGNPFFVRESVRLLAQGRPLDTVPAAVAELVRQRLAILGPQAGEALQIAAVVGRDFDPVLVAEVVGSRSAGVDVYDLLDRGAQIGLLVSRDGRMAFAHDLVREALIDSLPPLGKALIHRHVMVALSARPRADVAVVAYHAVEAGPAAYEEAVRWAGAAAEQATLRLAYEEAATWWDRAVKAHDAAAGDPGTHVELLLKHVRALLDAGDPITARQVRADAIRTADRVPERPDLAVQALTALDAPTLWTTRDPYEAVELRLVHRLQTALDNLPDDDSPERARLLGGLAQELYDGSGNPRCDTLSRQAVDMARRLHDPYLLMRMLNARHLALPQPLHLAELTRIADELHELAVTVQAPAFELLAQMLHTHNHLEAFDLAAADQAATRCQALLQRLPQPWPRFQHTLWQANRLALEGRFHDAEKLRDEAERQAERVGVWHARPAVAMSRLAMRCQQGAMADAGPLVDAISGVHPTMDHDARVLHLLAQGREGEARALARAGWPSPPLDWSWLSTTCLQAAAQAAVGDRTACDRSYATLLPYSGRISTISAVMCMGPVDWYLTLLATAMGDHDSAARHLAVIARLAERNGLTWWRDRAMGTAAALRRRTSG